MNMRRSYRITSHRVSSHRALGTQTFLQFLCLCPRPWTPPPGPRWDRRAQGPIQNPTNVETWDAVSVLSNFFFLGEEGDHTELGWVMIVLCCLAGMAIYHTSVSWEDCESLLHRHKKRNSKGGQNNLLSSLRRWYGEFGPNHSKTSSNVYTV